MLFKGSVLLLILFAWVVMSEGKLLGEDPYLGRIGPCSAHPLDLGYTPNLYQTNYGANPSTLNTCNLSENTPVIWYSMLPSRGSKVSISTCSAYTTFNTVLSLYTGLCSDLTCEQYTSVESNCNTLSFTSNGEFYYLAVSGFPGNSSGNFELIVEYTGGDVTNCSAPINLPFTEVPTRFWGESGVASPVLANCTDEYTNLLNNYVYYQFTLDEWYEVNFFGCRTDLTRLDADLFIQSNDCNQPTCLISSGCEIEGFDLPAGTYLLGVGAEHNFQITYFFQEF